MTNPSIKQVSDEIRCWMVMRDSVNSYLSRDTTVSLEDDVVMEYFAVADSIRASIHDIMKAKKPSVRDVTSLKFQTDIERESMLSSPDYKDAEDFFSNLDKDATTYDSPQKTVTEYLALLDVQGPFKTANEMLQFIRKEDKCFRSTLHFLNEMPQETITALTAKTAHLFERVYEGIVSNPDSQVSKQADIFLSMRLNRRVIENATVCARNVEKSRVSAPLVADYRWMVLQPFISLMMNEKASAVITEKQATTLLNLADKLPAILSKIDRMQGNKLDPDNTTEIICDFFLSTYLYNNL